VDNLKILLRLYRQYTKMDLLWFLRDTRYCLLQIVSDTICACCTIAGVFLLSEKFGGFGGMNQAEILFMMGFSTLVDGIYMMFFIGNNTAMISRIIGRGQLDHVMIQPVPIWAELLAQGFSPLSGSSMLICGIGLTTYAVSRLPISVTLSWLMLLLIYAASATALIISFMTLLSCAAFYAPCRGDRPGGQGFIYISEDLSVRYDEPFSKTAVPDRTPSGTGGLVSIGAAFKGGLRRI